MYTILACNVILLDHSSTGQCLASFLGSFLRQQMLLLRRLPPALLLRQLRTPSPPLPLQTALSSLDMQVALLFHRFLPDLTGLQTQAPLFI